VNGRRRHGPARLPGAAARAVLAALLGAVPLAGCDWVDSAGNDGDVPSSTPSLGAQPTITFEEQPLNGATAVQEDSTARLLVSRAGDATRDVRFETTPLESGVLDSCLAIDGFGADRAADSLEAACSGEPQACALRIERDDNADALGIVLSIPALKAPVGLRHQLALGRRMIDAAGDEVFVEDEVRQIDLCLIAINEAPLAVDDNYVVFDGGELTVGAGQGVLVNDEDDEDVGNEPLRASLQSGPGRARSFELVSDGGFSYVPEPIRGGADVLDTFTYRAGDGGAQSAPATVTVRTVIANQAPRQSAELPVVTGRVGLFLSIDLARYFVDPEAGRLSYSFLEPLPDGGTLSLGSTGALAGVPGRGDAGDFVLTLVVSDGRAETSVPLTLLIGAAAVDEAPVFTPDSVDDQSILLGQAIVPVRPVFEDPEGEPLTYRAIGNRVRVNGLVLDADTGVLSGRPNRRGLLSNLVIEASDPAGNATRSAPFSIRVF